MSFLGFLTPVPVPSWPSLLPNYTSSLSTETHPQPLRPKESVCHLLRAPACCCFLYNSQPLDVKSVTGSFAQHLKGTPTECHDPLDQADGGLCPTSLPEDMGSRVPAPCSGGAHNNTGQHSHTPPWTALLLAPSLDSPPGPRSVRSGGKQALTSSLEALSPRGPQECESASSQPLRVQRDTGTTCGQPAGSDAIEERTVRG